MTRIRAVFTAVVVGLVLALLSTAPAAAHTGKLKLEVAGDGAEGVTIQATYSRRAPAGQAGAAGPHRHRSGRAAGLGPVQLEPAPRGRASIASGPLLAPGKLAGDGDRTGTAPGKATADIAARRRHRLAPPAPARPAPMADRVAAGSEAGASWWRDRGAGLVLTAGALMAALGCCSVAADRHCQNTDAA